MQQLGPGPGPGQSKILRATFWPHQSRQSSAAGCFVLKITSNDDVCGPVEYPCSTNHVEINDVYVCIHNGWGELRKSALSELSLTNKNKHEYYGASQPQS